MKRCKSRKAPRLLNSSGINFNHWKRRVFFFPVFRTNLTSLCFSPRGFDVLLRVKSITVTIAIYKGFRRRQKSQGKEKGFFVFLPAFFQQEPHSFFLHLSLSFSITFSFPLSSLSNFLSSLVYTFCILFIPYCCYLSLFLFASCIFIEHWEIWQINNRIYVLLGCYILIAPYFLLWRLKAAMNNLHNLIGVHI